jgi:hypothetical protein
VWIVGTAGAAISYQAFAIIPVLAWLSCAGRPRDSLTPRVRVVQAILPPGLAAVFLGAVVVVLNQVAQSSRLGGLDEENEPGAIALSSLFLAYGRPEQVALGWAIVILAVTLVVQIIRSVTTPGAARRLSSILTLSVGSLALAVLPLVLSEAREGRFASTVQIAIVIGFATQAFANATDNPTETAGWKKISLGVVPGLTVMGALLLALTGYSVAGATLAVVLVVWTVLLLVLWAVDIPRTAALFVGLMVVASLTVSYSMARDQLARNWVDIGLDQAIASEIALEMSRLDLSKTEVVEVSYDVVGDADWPSPLLRVYVSGPGVLQHYLESLRDITPRVTGVDNVCEPGNPDLVTVRAESDTSVTVCVNVDTLPAK